MKVYIFLPLVLFSSLSRAASLEDIAVFANKICEQVKTTGFHESTEIKGKIKGKISPKALSKILGVKVAADGSYTLSGENHVGLPYESLPAQLTSVRECKENLALMLIKERLKVIDQAPIKSPVKYSIKRSVYHSMLMEKPDYKSYLAFAKGTPLQIKTLMDGTKVNILEEKVLPSGHRKTASDIVWYKVEVTSGPDKELIGWIPQRNVIELTINAR